ncbi:MAG: DsbA family protein [Pikeienuella sp.]|uniref:DsbA family protein n=1 Tax=Pikeienuella sp. TaxID=2831957 RepID=UPI00391B76F3
MTYRSTRREALALGLGAAALAGLPAFALEEKGYALGDVVIGDPDAPVTIIEYASLTCPHCASFHVNAWPQIKAEYVDTGKAKFIVREVYFDQFGLWSAMIARCAGTEGYPMLIGMFLERQRGWYLDHVGAFNETKNAAPIIEEMMKIGRLAGLSNDRMNACLGDQELLERMVGDFQTNSAADEIRSTPTFLINGEVVSGSVPAGQMAEVIERKLAGG